MIIYATPFRASDKQATGPSVNLPFKSIDEVIQMMGPDHIYCNKRMVVYGPDEDRVVYSDFIFCIDHEVSNG